MVNKPILPPAMLGILGGGQLGRMFTVAAKTMGYQVTVLDPDPNAPAADFADVHLAQPYTDVHALAELARTCAAITTEFENVNADSMRWLAQQGIPVSPSGECVAIAQDRIAEKTFIRNSGLDTAPFLAIRNSGDLDVDLSPYLPGILKTARLGYDGKGQVRVQTLEEARLALSNMKHQACVLEKMLPLVAEVSAIVTRTRAAKPRASPLQKTSTRTAFWMSLSCPRASAQNCWTRRAAWRCSWPKSSITSACWQWNSLCWKATAWLSTKWRRVRITRATTRSTPR